MSIANTKSLSQGPTIKPAISASETKAEITHNIATAITEHDYAKRVAKTDRLKKARLDQESRLISAEAKKTPLKRQAKK